MQAITLEVIMRAVFGIRRDAHVARVRSVLARQIETAARPGVLALLLALGPERVHRHGLLRADHRARPTAAPRGGLGDAPRARSRAARGHPGAPGAGARRERRGDVRR